MYSSYSSTSAYVSDLPVRLTNQFRPLLNYESLNGVQECSLQFPATALEEYDFTAEKKALQDFESHMRSLAELQHPIQSVGGGTAITLERPQLSTSSDMPPVSDPALSARNYSTSILSKSLLSTSSPSVTPDGFRPAVLLSNASSILQPTPASSSVRSDQEARSSSTDRKNAQSRVALSLEDFENVQSSPFDALELKTINDIEELRRISTQQQPFLPVNPSQKKGFLL